MAYVRITETLIDDMVRNIRAMSKDAQAPYRPSGLQPGSPEYDAVLGSLETQVWSLAPHLRGQIPEEWLLKVNKFYARFLAEDGHLAVADSIDLPEDSPIYVPFARKQYYSFECDVHYENQCAATRAWIKAEADRADERRQIFEQYEAVCRQVKAFLGAQTSLNVALKEMPELELYTPDGYLQRLKAPNPKRANKTAVANPKRANKTAVAKPEVHVDRDQLAALGIAHRISTAAE